MENQKIQSTSFFHILLARIFAVNPGEWRMFTLMGVSVFSTISSYLILKAVGRSMFLHKVGSEYLPYVYIMVAVIVGVIASIYGRLSKRTTLIRLIFVTHGVIIINLALFWYLLKLDIKTPWFFYIF